MTQLDMILNILKDKGSITSFEAIKKIGCTRLSARVYELKKLGYKIDTRTIAVKNRFNQKVYVTEYLYDK